MTAHAAALASALLAPALAAAGAPLTLEEALAEAARRSPDLRLARADRDVAAAGRTAAWSNVLPRLDLTASFGRLFVGPSDTRVAPGVSFAVPATSQEDYQLGLQLQQPIFDGLRSWSRVAAGKARARSAERSLDESTLAVAFEVTRRFLEVVRAERNLAVLEEAARRSEEVLRRTEALHLAGRVPKSEVINAQVNKGNDRILAEAQRASVTRARVDLSLALGRDADPELAVVAPSSLAAPAAPPGEDPPPLEALVATARRERPLLLARLELQTAADADVGAARGGFWPNLSALLSYDRSSGYLAGRDGVYADWSRQYVATARLAVSWNLFDGLATSASVSQAEAAAARARVQAEQVEHSVAGEIASARALLVVLRREVRLVAENLAAAREGLALARDRLDKGAATQLEVRDAELKLTQASLALVGARIDEAIARADLERATGAVPSLAR